jgi:hypothetical protein
MSPGRPLQAWFLFPWLAYLFSRNWALTVAAQPFFFERQRLVGRSSVEVSVAVAGMPCIATIAQRVGGPLSEFSCSAGHGVSLFVRVCNMHVITWLSIGAFYRQNLIVISCGLGGSTASSVSAVCASFVVSIANQPPLRL